MAVSLSAELFHFHTILDVHRAGLAWVPFRSEMQLTIAGLVDERGDISRTKTIVDIDDSHIGRT
jgi:hypothetical protein